MDAERFGKFLGYIIVGWVVILALVVGTVLLVRWLIP